MTRTSIFCLALSGFGSDHFLLPIVSNGGVYGSAFVAPDKIGKLSTLKNCAAYLEAKPSPYHAGLGGLTIFQNLLL